MPVRFRCVYCDKLLGIARRKAGTIVTCPHCHEKLIVPTPTEEDVDVDLAEEKQEFDPPPAPKRAVIREPAAVGDPPKKEGRLFENSNYEKLLDGPVPLRESPGEAAQRAILPKPGLPPMPPKPMALPSPPEKTPKGMIFLYVLLGLILLGASFAAGIVVGKGLRG